MRAFLCGTVVLSFLGESPLYAQPPTRIAVRAENAADRLFAERLRGQLSDIDGVDLVVVNPDDGGEVVLSPAWDLARAHRAQIVVLFERSAPDPLRVRVIDVDGGREYSRALSTQPARMASSDTERSAQAESAALVTRTLIRSILAGTATDDAASTLPSLSLAPAPVSVSELATAVPATLVVARSRPRFFLSLGWRTAVDGVSPGGQHGAWLRATVGKGGQEAGIEGSLGLPSLLVDPRVQVELVQHRLLAHAGLAWRLGRLWSFALSARGGAVAFSRRTATTSPFLRPTQHRTTWSALVGADLRLAWVWPGASRWQVMIGAGADYLPGAPVLGIRDLAEFITVWPLWSVQPVASLGIQIAF